MRNDHTVPLGAEQIQLLPDPRQRGYANVAVEVHERLDGRIAVFYQGTRIPCRSLPPTPSTARVRARRNPRMHLAPTDAPRIHLRRGSVGAPPSRPTRPGGTDKTKRATSDAHRRIERDGARDLIHGGICRWARRNPHRQVREDKIADLLIGQNH